MLVMGGAALAEDELSDLHELNDPDTVFPESEPPFIEFTPPDSSLDPDDVFLDAEPPFFVPMPPEFPVAPVDDGLSQRGFPQFDSSLFPPEDPRMIELIMPPAIPGVPEDGDYGDAAQAGVQAVLATIGNTVVDDLRDYFPGPVNMIDRARDLASEHPYATAGLGSGLLIGATILADAGLDEYGDNVNQDSVTIPIPAYQNPDVRIPRTDNTIGISVSSEIERNVSADDWVWIMIGLNY